MLRIVLCVMAYMNLSHFFVDGLSPVRVKSKSAIEVTKSTTLHCDYFLDNAGEELYSVLWYWTPKSSTYTSVDLRLLDKSGLSLPPQLPQGPVQFFRYRKDDQNGKRAWEDRLRGIFNVNIQGSTRTSVRIDRVSLSAEGTFSCEVTTHPEYITKQGSTYIRVAQVPNYWARPEVRFHENKLRYQPNETVEVECVSKGGYPPPKITWFINGEKVRYLIIH